MTLVPGMTLWYVPRDRRGAPRTVTVSKVGRKWAHIDYGERVDMETLAVDGGAYSSPAQCYGSREEYEEQLTHHKAWEALRRAMPYSPPDGVTTDDIKKAAELLGMSLGEVA